jgi:hypothetical protein
MRAQSHVVGVALMLGLGVIALGTLTLTIGALVDSQAGSADAQRVADGFDRAIQGPERTGLHRHEVRFSEGHLSTADRTLRILENGSVVERVPVDALVFENDDNRVTAVAGAVVREGGGAWFVSEPRIVDSEANAVLVVSAPVLNASSVAAGGEGGVTKSIRTNVSHERTELGTGEYAVAVETTTPRPFEEYFAAQNATVDRRQFAGDEAQSVVARYPGRRQAYLVVHDLRLEVGNG